MNSHQVAIKEALKVMGLKKLQAEVLTLAEITHEKSAGQVVINTNGTGVTNISLNNWKVE